MSTPIHLNVFYVTGPIWVIQSPKISPTPKWLSNGWAVIEVVHGLLTLPPSPPTCLCGGGGGVGTVQVKVHNPRASGRNWSLHSWARYVQSRPALVETIDWSRQLWFIAGVFWYALGFFCQETVYFWYTNRSFLEKIGRICW